MTDDEQDLWERSLSLPRLRQPGELSPLFSLLPEGAIVAELGSFSGESAVQFLASPRVSRLICVDQWVAGYDDGADDASRSDMAAARAAFNIRIRRRVGDVTVLPFSTLQAAHFVPDASLDMVYIDADHRFGSVVADIRAWQTKVKPGGWIAGHDYSEHFHLGVKQAVDSIFGQPGHVLPDYNWAKRINTL